MLESCSLLVRGIQYSGMKPFAFTPLLFMLWATSANAQPGCPDPQATNFNSWSTSNDGSCLYPVTNYSPVFNAVLPNNLQEISGLAKADSRWWCHNDSGDDERFFQVNPETGSILQEVSLLNAYNRDWEDIASDDEHIYLGDFGNNTNDRQDLGIYKVPLSAIGNSSLDTVHADEWTFLPFSYEDQTDFSTQPADSSVFDCESMISFNGKIHLFTKSRRYNATAHYILNTGASVAEKAETFEVEGLITGASVSQDGNLIALVGYDLRPFIPTVFCWLLWDWKAGADLFFSGNKRRIELGSALQVGQVESIGFDSNRSGYISNEVTKFNGVTIVAQSVRSFDFSPWVPVSVATGEPRQDNIELTVFPNPFSQTVGFKFSDRENPDFLRVKNMLGQTISTLNEIPETLELGYLPPGFYVFETLRDGQPTGWFKVLKQ